MDFKLYVFGLLKNDPLVFEARKNTVDQLYDFVTEKLGKWIGERKLIAYYQKDGDNQLLEDRVIRNYPYRPMEVHVQVI